MKRRKNKKKNYKRSKKNITIKFKESPGCLVVKALY